MLSLNRFPRKQSALVSRSFLTTDSRVIICHKFNRVHCIILADNCCTEKVQIALISSAVVVVIIVVIVVAVIVNVRRCTRWEQIVNVRRCTRWEKISTRAVRDRIPPPKINCDLLTYCPHGLFPVKGGVVVKSPLSKCPSFHFSYLRYREADKFPNLSCSSVFTVTSVLNFSRRSVQ